MEQVKGLIIRIAQALVDQKYPGLEPTNNLKLLINTVAEDPDQVFRG